MSEAGFEKSAEQCRDKGKKLKSKYRKVKDKHRVTGEGRKRWKFLEAMDNVLADKPSTHPTTLIDTSSDDPVNKNSMTASEEQSVDKNDVTLNDDDRALSTDNDSLMSPHDNTDSASTS